MALNQLTDEQIDDEILRMVIEESMNINININDDDDDDDDDILHMAIEESKKTMISEKFEDIVKKNDNFLSETINKFNKLQNIEKTEKIENTPLTLEQLREKRLKRFTQA